MAPGATGKDQADATRHQKEYPYGCLISVHRSPILTRALPAFLLCRKPAWMKPPDVQPWGSQLSPPDAVQRMDDPPTSSFTCNFKRRGMIPRKWVIGGRSGGLEKRAAAGQIWRRWSARPGGEAGVDSAWEQEKPEASLPAPGSIGRPGWTVQGKMLENRAESPASSARFVGRRFWLLKRLGCYSYFSALVHHNRTLINCHISSTLIIIVRALHIHFPLHITPNNNAIPFNGKSP